MFAQSRLRCCAALLVVLGLGGFAGASPMVSDVIALPSGLPATAVAGEFSGNNLPTDLLNMLNAGLFPSVPTGWSLVGSSDEAGNGPFTSNPTSTSGTLTFDTLINGPFVIALKAGDTYAAYFFDDTFGNVSGVNFTIGFLNNGGQIPDLSHASLYVTSVLTGTATSTSTSTSTATATNTATSTNIMTATATNVVTATATATSGVIPEPTTLALWGVLAGGMALFGRRRAVPTTPTN